MDNWKGTPGKLEIKFMPGDICIGIGTVGDYCQITANSILPESDEEYAKEKEELEANMRLYAAAPELLEALNMFVDYCYGTELQESERFKKGKEAIEKALK